MTRYGSGNSGVGPWVWGGCGCCLGCLAIPIVVAAILGAGVFAVFRGTDVVDGAMERARAHPVIQEALGEPITRGWQIQGEFHVSDDEGEVDVRIPISGPNGEGGLSIEAHKEAGTWVYDRLEVVLEGSGEVVDLLEAERMPNAERESETIL